MEQKDLNSQQKKRIITVTNSFGVRDCYKLIRKNHWFNIPRPLKESEFYHIIRQVNKLLAEEIALGHTVTFPATMGSLELRKYRVGVSIVDGKLKNTYHIDWGQTKKLWGEDEEAFRDKILLRFEKPYHYHVKYLKDKANYQNKQFYQIQLNQKLWKQLMKNINNGITDTLW